VVLGFSDVVALTMPVVALVGGLACLRSFKRGLQSSMTGDVHLEAADGLLRAASTFPRSSPEFEWATRGACGVSTDMPAFRCTLVASTPQARSLGSGTHRRPWPFISEAA
jgi:hypothetical protein